MLIAGAYGRIFMFIHFLSLQPFLLILCYSRVGYSAAICYLYSASIVVTASNALPLPVGLRQS